jgi:hypothetical protein
MDHILGNKAQFKDRTEKFGAAAMAAGATAAASGNDDAARVGGIVAAVGLVSHLISAASNPSADVRMWENLPRYLSATWLDLPPGRYAGVLEPLRDGQPVASMPIEVQVEDTPAPIIFLSNLKY